MNDKAKSPPARSHARTLEHQDSDGLSLSSSELQRGCRDPESLQASTDDHIPGGSCKLAGSWIVVVPGVFTVTI